MTRLLSIALTVLATLFLLVAAAPTVMELEQKTNMLSCPTGSQQPQCTSCGGENTSVWGRGFCNTREEGKLWCPCCPKPQRELECRDCGGHYKVTEDGVERTVCVGLQEERWTYHGCGCQQEEKVGEV
ncbi:hypothetical protein EX30DRAFT_339498 [Ascodesmis nigricans]|uniref:Uncharacterized protein n=1 Tax=Ascodesmis nigricans TaxID=341454 RepID=A0A4S2N2H0_9PEZI|nr:hypothetical protein EX30DRAFT_339498 [Ascodesmis nigricans]